MSADVNRMSTVRRAEQHCSSGSFLGNLRVCLLSLSFGFIQHPQVRVFSKLLMLVCFMLTNSYLAVVKELWKVSSHYVTLIKSQ